MRHTTIMRLNHWTVKFAAASVVGAALGYAFYALIGCNSGGCPLTSNPWSASIGGAVFGALVVKG